MTLSDEYQRQFAWRDWSKVFDLLPPLAGKTVLDLGCAIGDQAAELAARGARVIGIELNEALLATARARGIRNAEFRAGDLRALQAFGEPVDGIWCSFAPAYVPNLGPTLLSWKEHLEPGGWVALTEIDELFGHEPVEPQTRALLDEHVRNCLAAGRYDFRMGRELGRHLLQAGYELSNTLVLEDQEFSFDGPASAEVIEGWTARLDRMAVLQAFCGSNFDRVRADFLAALAHPEHRSLTKVCCCIARWQPR